MNYYKIGWYAVWGIYIILAIALGVGLGEWMIKGGY